MYVFQSKAAFKDPIIILYILRTSSKAKYWKVKCRLHYFSASFLYKATELCDYLPGFWELINTWLALWRNKICTPSRVNAVTTFPFKIHYGFLCPFLLVYNKWQMFWCTMWHWYGDESNFFSSDFYCSFL